MARPGTQCRFPAELVIAISVALLATDAIAQPRAQGDAKLVVGGSIAAMSANCFDNICGGDPRAFVVQSHMGRKRCLDYTPEVVGSPVFLGDCSSAHPVIVQEVNGQHDVVLRAGTKVIGLAASRPGVAPPALLESTPSANGQASGADAPLVLLNPPAPNAGTSIFSPTYTFALDGDSILIAGNRTRVVKALNARGALGTPLVVSARALNDAEFWNFIAIDGSGRDPTTGFVHVATAEALRNALASAGPGTVIKVDEPDGSIDFYTSQLPLPPVGRAVTIRGDRKGVNPGPEIALNDTSCSGEACFMKSIFSVDDLTGDDVRITGLRLRGPTRSRDRRTVFPDGILTWDIFRTIVDRNEMSGFPYSTTHVRGREPTEVCEDPPPAPLTIGNVRVERNFIHHNATQGRGYGIVIGAGGSASIVGNTFLVNRHAIADDGTARSGYRAWGNLVLSNAPTYYDSFPPEGAQQDFDMHGTAPSGDSHVGGVAGGYVDIAWNTFFGDDRYNYSVRGRPCGTTYFRDNVSLQDHDDAIESHYDWVVREIDNVGHGRGPEYGPNGPPYASAPQLKVMNNVFGDEGYRNPTSRLAVGDFDGDGVDDLFLGTEAAWYVSFGGYSEWRLLSSGRTDRVASLLFGDFDGDGRTDVVGKNGRNLMVSWGGISAWELLNAIDAPIADLAVGNFTGDARSDIFYANGRDWYVADHGGGPFQPVNTSSFRVRDLRFGDFDGDGSTDVLGVVAGAWRVSYGAVSAWTLLRPRLTDTVNDLIVADFDGDGRADIATSERLAFNSPFWTWKFSSGGTAGWTSITTTSSLGAAAGVGHFAGTAQADVMLWGGDGNDVFYLAPGGTETPYRRSRQEMR